jgi:pimeloyl-ACP methyl ester carboxylesterase
MTERAETVNAAGRSIVVRTWGGGGAPAALYVHGAGDDGSQAAPLAAGLTGRWRVVAPDLPPPGAADAYAPSGVAAVLVAVLDALGIDTAVLVGFSWGASICCHVAARHPARVRALVLLEGGHIDFQDLRGFDPAAVADDPLGAGLAREPLVLTYPALRASGVPVLLVTAFRDASVDQLHVDPLARLGREVPQATIARIAATDHDLLRTEADAVAAIVRDWLDGQ